MLQLLVSFNNGYMKCNALLQYTVRSNVLEILICTVSQLEKDINMQFPHSWISKGLFETHTTTSFNELGTMLLHPT